MDQRHEKAPEIMRWFVVVFPKEEKRGNRTFAFFDMSLSIGGVTINGKSAIPQPIPGFIKGASELGEDSKYDMVMVSFSEHRDTSECLENSARKAFAEAGFVGIELEFMTGELLRLASEYLAFDGDMALALHVDEFAQYDN